MPRLTVRTAWFVRALRLRTVSDDCSNLLMPRVRGLRLRTVSDDVRALRLRTVSDDCSNLLMPRVRGPRLRTVSDDCLITVSARLCACQRALICMLVGVVQLD